MIAQTNKQKAKSMAEARTWLLTNGYQETKAGWLKGQSKAARTEQLASGRVAIIEGVAV
ncbi:hypothetical protein D3C77_29440 [compost metagenome]